jgi:uncharacterized membrane protein
MTATTAPSPWPAPAAAPRPGTWTFARELPDAGGGAPALEWLLKPNCSTTPRQLGMVYLSLCAVSLAIGGMFFWQGAPLVLGFAGLELLLVGLALVVFARHAGDREVLTLVGPSLLVEQRHGRHVERTDFATAWLRVEPAAGQGSLVELSGHGRTVRVGRFLRPELRGAFARELRSALRRLPLAPSAGSVPFAVAATTAAAGAAARPNDSN